MTPHLCLRGPAGERRCGAVLLAAVALAADHAITPSTPILRRAMLDESAHVAFTALIAETCGVRGGRFLRSALCAAVLIDVDHVPDTVFGCNVLSSGVPRPYTHSLVTLAAVLALSRSPWVQDRVPLEGMAFGVATHFLRDVTDGTGGVAMLWPLTSRSFRLPSRLNALTVLGAACRVVAAGSKPQRGLR